MRSVVLLSLLLPLSGCCRSGFSGGEATKEGPPGSAGAAATATAAPPALAPDGLPADIPTTRTPAPTSAEWDTAATLRVPSAVPLGCHLQMIREWVRVNCGSKRRTGGTPNGVQIQRSGCTRDSYTSMRSNANLVTALAPGHRCEVEFSWTEDKQLFVAEWQPGSRPALGFQPIAATPPAASSTNPLLPRRPLRIGK